jgi:ABC-type uncharacterized transport system permease subunit
MTGIGWLLVHLTLAKMTPLLLAAIGGLASERAGVINIALEGMMLAGAFGAAVGAALTGSAWLGLICGALCAGLLAALHGLACIRLRVDQIVSGTAVNLLSLGATGFLLFKIFGTHGSSPTAPKLPTVSLLPFVGGPFRQPVTTLIAILWPSRPGTSSIRHPSACGYGRQERHPKRQDRPASEPTRFAGSA